MWSNPKLKSQYIGNYEYLNIRGVWKRRLRLERRNAQGITFGLVYVFGNSAAAKKAGWVYTSN